MKIAESPVYDEIDNMKLQSSAHKSGNEEVQTKLSYNELSSSKESDPAYA